MFEFNAIRKEFHPIFGEKLDTFISELKEMSKEMKDPQIIITKEHEIYVLDIYIYPKPLSYKIKGFN